MFVFIAEMPMLTVKQVGKMKAAAKAKAKAAPKQPAAKAAAKPKAAATPKAAAAPKAKAKAKASAGNKIVTLGSSDGNKLLEKLQQLGKKPSDQDIDGFLGQLSPGERMSLWKKYEATRQAEPDVESVYKASCTGAGGNAKAREFLRMFLKDGGKVGVHSRSICVEVEAARKHGVRSEWVSLAEAQRMHGDDLPLLIRSKAVLVRKNPKCPQLMQFRTETEFQSSSRNQVTRASAVKQQQATAEQFADIWKNKRSAEGLSLHDFEAETFDADQSDSDGLDEDKIADLLSSKKQRTKAPNPIPLADVLPHGAASEFAKKAGLLEEKYEEAAKNYKKSLKALPKNQEWWAELRANREKVEEGMGQAEILLNASTMSQADMIKVAKVTKMANAAAKMYRDIMA